MLKTLIIFILMIGFLISIHELGHLIAAKWAGVYCYEYSIGMGPLIFKRKGKETQFSIRALPIGGYVAMAGETEDSQEAYPDIVVPSGRHLFEVPKWKQAIVMLAGIIMNLLVAFVLMYIAVMVNGGYNDLSIHPAVVANVVEGSGAAKANLQVGDTIVAILDDGTRVSVETIEDVSGYLTSDQPITVFIDRNGQEIETSITPTLDSVSGNYVLGINTYIGKWIDANPISAIKGSIVMNIQMTQQIFGALIGIFTGDGLKNVSGFVGVYQATDQIIETGFVNILLFVGMFSLNLAIFNALPLPALDGGRVLLLGFEKILGKKMNKKLENWLIMGSFALLMGLTILVTLNDIIRLFK